MIAIEIKKTPIGDENETLDSLTVTLQNIEIKETPIGDENFTLVNLTNISGVLKLKRPR